jgi:hypothetical protein
MNKVHYIGMAGLHGCMPSACGVYDSQKDAAEGLASIHELGKNRTAELRRTGYLELNMNRDGNEYAEISECSCADPSQHGDE